MTTFMYTSEYDRVEAERDEARMWASAWKWAAHKYRGGWQDACLIVHMAQSELDTAKKRIEELEEALRFYADDGNWENDTLYVSSKAIADSSVCVVDHGLLARQALEEE